MQPGHTVIAVEGSSGPVCASGQGSIPLWLLSLLFLQLVLQPLTHRRTAAPPSDVVLLAGRIAVLFRVQRPEQVQGNTPANCCAAAGESAEQAVAEGLGLSRFPETRPSTHRITGASDSTAQWVSPASCLAAWGPVVSDRPLKDCNKREWKEGSLLQREGEGASLPALALRRSRAP